MPLLRNIQLGMRAMILPQMEVSQSYFLALNSNFH
jgi:hypothetical protein